MSFESVRQSGSEAISEAVRQLPAICWNAVRQAVLTHGQGGVKSMPSEGPMQFFNESVGLSVCQSASFFRSVSQSVSQWLDGGRERNRLDESGLCKGDGDFWFMG